MNADNNVSMLEKLKHDRVFDIETHDDGKLFMFVEKCDDWFTSTMSRDGLLKLIDEMRRLAGPDPDEGDGNLKPCPFCGGDPITGPANPEEEGNGWAFIECNNSKCPAHPRVEAYGDRGAKACLSKAMKKWNKRYT